MNEFMACGAGFELQQGANSDRRVMLLKRFQHLCRHREPVRSFLNVVVEGSQQFFDFYLGCHVEEPHCAN